MVDSNANSPSIDPDAYLDLQETIQELGRGYWSFNESSSNFAQHAG